MSEHASPVGGNPWPRLILLGSVVVLTVAVTTEVVSRQRDTVDGRPAWREVVNETFSSPKAFGEGWRASEIPGYREVRAVATDTSAWRVDAGVLVGDDRAGKIANLARVDLPGGALRAEWDLTPIVTDLNLNCFVGASNRLEGYTIHVGGWGRPNYLAITRGADLLASGTLAKPLVLNRTYRMRIECDEGRIGLWIDGAAMVSCMDPEPIAGSEQGGFGFETAWNMVHIDNLQAWVRPYLQRAAPLAAADAFASSGAYRRAAAAYLGFARTWPGDPLVGIARLRGARALFRAGLESEAVPMFSELEHDRDPAVVALARYELLHARAPTAGTAELDGLVAAVASSEAVPSVRLLALIAAASAIAPVDRQLDGPAVVAALARIRDWARNLGVEASELEPVRNCAAQLNRLGMHEEVLALCPDLRSYAAEALLCLGRYDEVVRGYADIPWIQYYAWSDPGRCDEGLKSLKEPFWRGRLLRDAQRFAEATKAASEYDRAEALVALDREMEALNLYPAQRHAVGNALVFAGRAQDALRLVPEQKEAHVQALLQLGRFAEAGELAVAGSQPAVTASALRAIDALSRGDQAAALTAVSVLEISPFTWGRDVDCFPQHFARFVLPGLIRWQAAQEDPKPVWTALAVEQRGRSGQRAGFRMRALAGQIAATEVLNQPFKAFHHPEVDAALVTAITADLARTPEAVAAWRAFLAAARPHQPVERAWAAYRLARLEAPTTPP